MNKLNAGTCFVIDQSENIISTMRLIDENKVRGIVVIDKHGSCKGVVTDGDIRRFILNGGSPEVLVGSIVKKERFSVSEDWRDEIILSGFAAGYDLIPVLDNDRVVIDVVTRENFENRKKIVAFARTPCRVSFGGGGTDRSDYFLSEDQGFVLNAALRKYANASISPSEHNYCYTSYDLDVDIKCTTWRHFIETLSGKAPLVAAVLEKVGVVRPFSLVTWSEVPLGSGLGGSSAMASSILAATYQFLGISRTKMEIIADAYHVERFYLNNAGGWQDQYAVVFGGFNTLSFKMDRILRQGINFSTDVSAYLESSLILVPTGVYGRNSGQITENNCAKFSSEESMKQVYELGVRAFEAISGSRLDDLGKIFEQSWKLKTTASNDATLPKLNDLYDLVCKENVFGGRLLGAGGGGYFMFVVDPVYRASVINNLVQRSIFAEPVYFDEGGLVSWTNIYKEA